MAKTARITFIEYDLRDGKDPVDAWLTVRWSADDEDDDEMQIYIGKMERPKFNEEALKRKALERLQEEAGVIADTSKLKLA